MKKIILLISAVTVLFCSSCSYKRSLGMVNNELLLRDWYGNTAFELSLNANTNTNFNSRSYIYSPYYMEEWDSANYETNLSLGLGASGLLYKNDFIKLSTGLKYEADLYIVFGETGRHTFIEGHDYYYHQLGGFIRFSGHSAALVFPDLEVSSPFSDDLKFIIKADLLRLRVIFDDASFGYGIQETNDTKDGEYESTTSVAFTPPGELIYMSFSSTYVDLGNLKIGLVYYFK